MRRKVPTKNVHLKRAYDTPEAADGTRILVDRLWPRGVKKDVAKIDLWAKDLSPSTQLRQWFGHDPSRWAEFKRRYIAELGEHAERMDELRKLAQHDPITLIYAARDREHNEAVILRDMLVG
ncbi:MAG: DUF488 domain-containing protein [Hyphomicrobiaceae bacterium]